MTLVWDRFPGAGSELLAMLSFADYASDSGENVRPSVDTMAVRMRLSRRQAQRVINGLLADGWVDIVGNPFGGRPGSTRIYRLNVDRLRQQSLFSRDDADVTGVIGDTGDANVTGDTRHRRGVTSGAETGDTGVTQSTIDPSMNHNNVSQQGCDAPQGKRKRSTEADRKCAIELYEKVLVVVPSARKPNILDWGNDIRLMREVDGRTHEEIQQLFLWANHDPFWGTNILSPRKLREKWNTLSAQRSRPPKKAIGDAARAAAATDSEVMQLGARYKIDARPGESMDQYRARVLRTVETRRRDDSHPRH